MKKLFLTLTACLILAVNSIPVIAAEKVITADVPKDYTAAKFIVSLDEEDDYTVTIISPDGSNSYEATRTGRAEYTYVGQDIKSGQWHIKVEVPDPVPAETPEGEVSEGEAPVEEAPKKEIGTVHVKIEGSSKQLAEVDSEIVVAEDVNGLKMYFKDQVFVAEWDDTSKGNMNVEITDSKTQERLASEVASNGHFECEINPVKHENITVTIVPTQSANIENAERRWTLPTLNEPDAVLEFEDAVITNKDTTPVKVTLGKDYRLMSYLNGKIVYDDTLKKGENNIELPTEVGDNSYVSYIVDLDTGYMKSYTYSIVKDVIAPVIKFASSYENITTQAENITFEGEIDTDYATFTINDADIKVEGDHTFKYTYELKEGINNIAIVAVDAAGNVSEYNTVITRVIPEVAEVPWAPIIISVSLVGLLVTYIVAMIMRRRRSADAQTNNKKVNRKKNSSPKASPNKKKVTKVGGDAIPEWLQFVLRVAIPVFGVYIILTHVVFVTCVASGSMEPKLHVGNTAVYNRFSYHNSTPQRGDIICFSSDEYTEALAKRVIGIPGDTIEFVNGYVFINGVMADESDYIGENIETNSTKTFTVPDGCVFVLGDNRENSKDSRFWDNPYIPYENIYGKYIGGLPFSFPMFSVGKYF